MTLSPSCDHVDIGLDRAGVAENAGVQVGGVAEVEKIVDDQLDIGLDGDAVALGRMQLRHVVHHGEIRNLRRIGRLVAHPDPDRIVLLEHRVFFHAQPRGDVLVAVRVEHAGARAVELKAVIGALDAVAVEHMTQAERGEAVRAAVVQRHDLAVALPEQHHRLVQDGAAEHAAVAEVFAPRRDIPGIVQVGPADELLLALQERAVVPDLDVHRSSSKGFAFTAC